jgi:hypothetical protein
LKHNFAHHLLRKAFRDTTVDRLLLNVDDREDTAATGWRPPVADNLCPEAHLAREATLDSSDDEDDDESVVSTASDDEALLPGDPFQHMRHVLDNGGEGEIPPGMPDGTEPAPLLFRRYSTLATVEAYFTLGVPMSLVLTTTTGPQRMGFIVATGHEWWLLPVRIGQVELDDDLGFTYFQIELYPTEEQRLVRTKQDGEHPTFHMELLNYVTLLPALWLQEPFPYAVVTTEGDHLDAAYNFV